jgi:hypothetical protein
MKSFTRAAIGGLAIWVLPVGFAGGATIDNGYTVDPCYKKCAPLLASVTPKAEAQRVYRNCFAYCSHKGSIQCPSVGSVDVFVPRATACH